MVIGGVSLPGSAPELQFLFGNINCGKFAVFGEKLHLIISIISMFFPL